MGAVFRRWFHGRAILRSLSLRRCAASLVKLARVQFSPIGTSLSKLPVNLNQFIRH